MKLNRTFSAPVSEPIARQRAINFLAQAGYKQLTDFENLRFKRGSITGTLSSFNPIKWACKAEISISSGANQAEVKVELEIKSDPFEKRFADELVAGELNRLEAAISNNEFVNFNSGEIAKKVAMNFYYIVGFLVGILISGAIAAFAGIYILASSNISPNAASLMGIGIFVILVFIMFLIWRRVKPKNGR